MASAAKDPLAIYQQTLKEFGIKEDQISPIRLASYLGAQRDEIQTVLVRALIDVVHAARLKESDNEILRNKGLERESQHKNEVRQFYGGLQMIDKLIGQLRETYPELKQES